MDENAELFQLENGRYITSEALSQKMFYIKSVHPESANQREDTGYSWDEAGMADLFSECYTNEARYCKEAKSWYVYDEGVWQMDVGALLIARKIKEFVRLMALYCGEIADEDIRKKYCSLIAKMGDRRFRDRIAKDAEETMLISLADFDRDPFLINCLNGTFDLKTCVFRPHNYSDYLTMQTRFEYTRQNVKCERWNHFIAEVTENDKDKMNYLQKALGYSMLGKANEECMFILHGKSTRNGKSTLLSTIEYMLSDYATQAPVELICRTERSRGVENASPVLARLKGRRFVTMSESASNGKLDEEVIKQYTGGEAVTARELYGRPFTFIPQFTLWLSCNDLPAVRDKSLFASKRLKVIEFNRHFREDEQDNTLKDFFRTPDAMTGIFSWLVDGYFKYRLWGLEMPESMLPVVRRYEKDNDTVLQFLEQCCQHTDGGCPAKVLYENYKCWCRSNGYYVYSAKKFNAALRANPEWYSSERKVHNALIYDGISFVSL